jgi:hypothetical protein
MMKTCIKEHRTYYVSYEKARDTCFCAVESMSGFLDAEKARFYGKAKLEKILKERYKECTN